MDEAALKSGMEQRPDGSWYDPKIEAKLEGYDPQKEEFAKAGSAQKFARALASGRLPDPAMHDPTPDETIAEADDILAESSRLLALTAPQNLLPMLSQGTK
jgi:hypothetical protein